MFADTYRLRNSPLTMELRIRIGDTSDHLHTKPTEDVLRESVRQGVSYHLFVYDKQVIPSVVLTPPRRRRLSWKPQRHYHQPSERHPSAWTSLCVP